MLGIEVVLPDGTVTVLGGEDPVHVVVGRGTPVEVLEEAGLLISEKQGRTRRLYFNSAPIQMIHERWTTEYSALWAGKLTRFKHLVEDQSA